MSDPMEAVEMADILQQMAEIDKEFKKIGITEATIDQIADLVVYYKDCQEAIIRKRDKQFYESAWAFCAKYKTATGKVVDGLTLFLREFAEHITREVALQYDISMSVVDAVDHCTNSMEEKDHV